jgi:hypothetical protein
MIDQNIVDGFKVGAASVGMVAGSCGIVASIVVCCGYKARFQMLARIANDKARPEDEHNAINEFQSTHIFSETSTVVSRFLRLCGCTERADRIDRLQSRALRRGFDSSSDEQQQCQQHSGRPLCDCAGRCGATQTSPIRQGCRCLPGGASASGRSENEARPNGNQAGIQEQDTRLQIGIQIGRAANEARPNGRQAGGHEQDTRVQAGGAVNDARPAGRQAGRQEQDTRLPLAQRSAPARPTRRPSQDSRAHPQVQPAHAAQPARAQPQETRIPRAPGRAKTQSPSCYGGVQRVERLPQAQSAHTQASSASRERSDAGPSGSQLLAARFSEGLPVRVPMRDDNMLNRRHPNPASSDASSSSSVLFSSSDAASSSIESESFYTAPLRRERSRTRRS